VKGTSGLGGPGQCQRKSSNVTIVNVANALRNAQHSRICEVVVANELDVLDLGILEDLLCDLVHAFADFMV
jgi:hypothetical protein